MARTTAEVEPAGGSTRVDSINLLQPVITNEETALNDYIKISFKSKFVIRNTV